MELVVAIIGGTVGGLGLLTTFIVVGRWVGRMESSVADAATETKKAMKELRTHMANEDSRNRRRDEWETKTTASISTLTTSVAVITSHLGNGGSHEPA